MKTVPYSLVAGNLMYALVCTCPGIAFVVGVLGRYLSDSSQSHWKAAKKVLRYLSGYQGSHVDISGYRDS